MKQPSDTSIIAAFGWNFSVRQLVDGFREMGMPTTAAHIEDVWAKAKARGDLPPLERPENGFDLRHLQLVELLRCSPPIPPYAHGKTASQQGGSSA